MTDVLAAKVKAPSEIAAAAMMGASAAIGQANPALINVTQAMTEAPPEVAGASHSIVECLPATEESPSAMSKSRWSIK